jgi:hypothetical protein
MPVLACGLAKSNTSNSSGKSLRITGKYTLRQGKSVRRRFLFSPTAVA